jgi:hypothetical protein
MSSAHVGKLVSLRLKYMLKILAKRFRFNLKEKRNRNGFSLISPQKHLIVGQAKVKIWFVNHQTSPL